MSLATLLTQTVTLLRFSAGVEDDYGNVTESWTPAGTVKCRLEQRASREVTQDRQTVVSDWVMYCPPTVVIGEQDRIADGYGRTFEVVGAPAMQSSPTRDVYVEVSLRHVSGV